GTFSNLMSFIPWRSAAKQYSDKAQKIEQDLGDPSLQIELAVYLAAYNLANGNFEAGRQFSQQAAVLCEQLGNLYYLALHKATEVWIAMYCDVDAERAFRLNNEMHSLAVQNNYTQQLVWALTYTQLIAYRFAKDANSIRALSAQFDPLLTMLETSTDAQQKIRVYTLLSQVHLDQGNRDQALAFASGSLTLLSRSATTFICSSPPC